MGNRVVALVSEALRSHDRGKSGKNRTPGTRRSGWAAAGPDEHIAFFDVYAAECGSVEYLRRRIRDVVVGWDLTHTTIVLEGRRGAQTAAEIANTAPPPLENRRGRRQWAKTLEGLLSERRIAVVTEDERPLATKAHRYLDGLLGNWEHNVHPGVMGRTAPRFIGRVEDGRVIVYADAAHDAATSAAGIAWWAGNRGWNVRKIQAPNNTDAEILAAAFAASSVPDGYWQVEIRSDCQTVGFAFQRIRNGETATEAEHALVEATRGRDVTVRYVLGHQGVMANNAVDKLAKTALFHQIYGPGWVDQPGVPIPLPWNPREIGYAELKLSS